LSGAKILITVHKVCGADPNFLGGHLLMMVVEYHPRHRDMAPYNNIPLISELGPRLWLPSITGPLWFFVYSVQYDTSRLSGVLERQCALILIDGLNQSRKTLYLSGPSLYLADNHTLPSRSFTPLRSQSTQPKYKIHSMSTLHTRD